MMGLENEEILKSEYLLLQNIISNFDGRALTIKAWSITFSMTSIGLAYATKLWIVLLISVSSALVFWVLEATWKSFQYAHYQRSGQIEDYFSGKKANIVPLQIGSNWNESFNKGGGKRLIKIMFWKHVMLPHALVFSLGLALLGAHTFDIFVI